MFEVLKTNGLASIQDLGRMGSLAYGVGASGAMDQNSHRWANRVLGNDENNATLEIVLGDVQLKANTDTWICVTGADLGFMINGVRQPRYQAIQVKAGDELNWSRPYHGARAYLSVSGGWQIPEWFGSRSVNAREHLGEAVQIGDVLPIGQTQRKPPQIEIVQSNLTRLDLPIVLRVLPTYQWGDFSESARQTLFGQTFNVSSQGNRVGIRLQGESIESPYSKMYSQAMMAGAIQIPPNGQAIVMMRDHPTMGGYPKIGAVRAQDLDRLAQALPNTPVQFRPQPWLK